MPLDPLTGAMIFGGATNIANSAINAKQAKKQRDHEFELSKYAYSQDREMWNDMNEYNTPKNQMKRFGEAGLNPHLIYGKGTAGNPTTMPKYQAPRAEYPALNLRPDLITIHQDLKMKQAQTEGQKIANKSLLIDNAIKSADLELKGYDVKNAPKKAEYQKQFWEADIAKTNKQILQLAKDIDMKAGQISWMEKKLEGFTNSGVNIDKDGILDRKMWEAIETGTYDEKIGVMAMILAMMGLPTRMLPLKKSGAKVNPIKGKVKGKAPVNSK